MPQTTCFSVHTDARFCGTRLPIGWSNVLFDDNNLNITSVKRRFCSVTALQELLHVCEGVLFISRKKSVCMHIGPR